MDLEQDLVRAVRSRPALDSLIDRIEKGEEPSPHWIHLQAAARLDRIDSAEWPALLIRLHGVVRRGFRTALPQIPDADKWLDDWRCIARHGFHDFGDEGWAKCYDSPFAEDYDYLAAYLECGQAGLDAIDPYAVYSAVLGSHDYGVEDFLRTDRCHEVRTLIEPMAGTAEFAYQGHFQFPDFRYLMIDLDAEARDRVLARHWLEDTERHYFVSDVLDEEVWKQVKATSSGPALAFVGKQSHHLFDTSELCRLLELGTLYADSLVFETPALALVSDMPSEEELTRPEMEAAGLHVGLVDDPGVEPNPFTNQISFRLDAWDDTGRRTLFRYPRWTVWSPHTLVALAELHGLHGYYFHSELDQFVPVSHDASASDCHDNSTFMLFSRDAR